jgi:hypothetical protein
MAQEQVYDLGDTVRITGTFRDDTGTLTTPTTVTVTIVGPDGTSTAYVMGSAPEVANPSAGLVVWTWVADTPGRHVWQLVGTGAVAEGEQGSFFVRPFS